MRIGCDIDGVLADIVTPWLELYNHYYKDNLKPSDITRWNIHEFAKPECGSAGMYHFLSHPALYPKAKSIPGALKGIRQLRKMGHTVVFITSGFFADKVEWLHWHRFIPEKGWRFSPEIIIAHDKSLIDVSVLIDDRPENLTHLPSFGRILLTQPWNAAYPHAQAPIAFERCNAWPEIVAYVKRLQGAS